MRIVCTFLALVQTGVFEGADPQPILPWQQDMSVGN